MDALELFLLGRRLMKIGEEAIPKAGFHELPSSVRLVLMDVFEHPGSSISDITTRTGFPQSHVSASVAKLRDGGAFVTEGDPSDRRRTIVRPSPEVGQRVAQRPAAPIEGALAAALGTDDQGQVGTVVAALESLAHRLTPRAQHAGGLGKVGQMSESEANRVAEFDSMYAGTPPWDIGRPQPAFASLADAGGISGRVLDVGCGTGEQALLAARLGLEATGIDASPSAIVLAQRKAADRGLSARFLVWNALELGFLGEQFDTVLDSGLFHVFADDERPRFVENLKAVLPPGGRYLMLCFSDRQPGTFGPRRVTQHEIRAAFLDGWVVESIEPATMDTTISPAGALAWLTTIRRA